MNYGVKKCVLCGKSYKPRSNKSWFCLDCYLNDYLPNKNKYGVDDFVSGIYSFITKRHIDNFYKPIEQIEIENSQNILTGEDLELKSVAAKLFEKQKIIPSANPEQAHKRLVDAFCSKTTYTQ
ncbi:hypothetical protein [Desulfovibrio sp. DV]|uniref:hypothetical protein n=1 Tax=Desulfovibrio sp. DV TaxID=1844708 RepID=UPI000B0ABB61|nr:hypothetical protein [Desulfovibrio sp. DV]